MSTIQADVQRPARRTDCQSVLQRGQRQAGRGGRARLCRGCRRCPRAGAKNQPYRRRAGLCLRHGRPAGSRHPRGASAAAGRVDSLPRRLRRGRAAEKPGHRDADSGKAATAQDSPRPRPGHADALRPAGHHHAGNAFRGRPREHGAGVRPLGNRPRPGDPAGQHQPSRERADDHRPQLPREGQRQHRQLGRPLVDRRRSGEAAMGHPLGRRHGDGPLHRQRTSTPRGSGSCGTRPCRSAPCRFTRPWRRSTARPRT